MDGFRRACLLGSFVFALCGCQTVGEVMLAIGQGAQAGTEALKGPQSVLDGAEELRRANAERLNARHGVHTDE